MTNLNLSRYALSVCVAVTLIMGCGGGSLPRGASTTSMANAVAAPNQRKPQYKNLRTIVLPLVGVSEAQLDAERAAGRTLPFFKGSIKSLLDGKRYKYRIVGQNPTESHGTTYIPYVPIVLVVTYPDGTVLDPTKPACGDTVSVESRFLNGPNFVPVDLSSNGVDVGTVQVGDAYQRAEFWKVLKSCKYHTDLLHRQRDGLASFASDVDSSASPTDFMGNQAPCTRVVAIAAKGAVAASTLEAVFGSPSN